MAHHTLPPTNLLARVRAWFGLNQIALALYLGMSPETVHSIETGRRALTTDVLLALRPLLPHLPPAEAAMPAPSPTPPPSLPAPDVAELDFRRRVCQQQATKLGGELAAIKARVTVAARWAQVLPALLRAAAEAHATPTPDNPERGTWLADWLTRQARPLPAEAATRAHLLRARLAGLAAEVAALAPTAQQP